MVRASKSQPRISEGSSGSPVLNEDGRVIAIARATWASGGQNLNFAIPIDAIRAAIMEGRNSRSALPRSNDKRRAQELPDQPPAAPQQLPSYQESAPPSASVAPATEREKRVVSFVRQLVASGNSGSNLPSPVSYYAPEVVYDGKLVKREVIARQVGTALKIFPDRSAQIVSGPFIDHSQPGPDTVVTYEVAALTKNELFRIPDENVHTVDDWNGRRSNGYHVEHAADSGKASC